MLFAHLLVHGENGLLATGDDGNEIRLGETLPDDVQQAIHDLAPVAARGLDRLGEDPVTQRVEVLEAEILKLEVQRVQSKPIGDGRVDIERFLGDALLVRLRHRIQRAHVMQPVGELDQDDAHVARHRKQHLAETFRLRFLARIEFDLIELGYAVDHVGDGFAEFLFQFGLGDRRVFHHIV